MTRGTFANVRVKNKLAVDPATGKVREGSWTRDLSKSGAGEIRSIYEASLNYQAEKRALIVLAGKDYGMGSSRDWAAKGTLLLGCRAVIAESFERIHRSNLVGMGVLPLCYLSGENAATLGLTGEEEFDIELKMNAKGTLEPRSRVLVTAHRTAGAPITFEVICRIDTPVEAEYYRNGGVLHTVLRRLRRENPPK
jgi:aconitate hydratase